jgi:hypothetical protein
MGLVQAFLKLEHANCTTQWQPPHKSTKCTSMCKKMWVIENVLPSFLWSVWNGTGTVRSVWNGTGTVRSILISSPPICAWAFHMLSFFFLRCLTKPSMNIFSPPCVPHALPISSSLICHSDNILLSSTIQEALHYALFSSLMLLPPS